MNDRELLEAAAKAAGIDAHWGDGWQADMMFRAVPRPNSPLVANVEWNPLTDDGDALRLATRLRLRLQMMQIGAGTARVERIEGGWSEYTEPAQGDEDAAMRRAIVRAAAEIGKGMK